VAAAARYQCSLSLELQGYSKGALLGEESSEDNLDASSGDDDDGTKDGDLTAFERKAQKGDKAAARVKALADAEAAAMVVTHTEQVCSHVSIGPSTSLTPGLVHTLLHFPSTNVH
jgi:hypothetical protein